MRMGARRRGWTRRRRPRPASDLRDRLANPDLDLDTRMYLIYAFGSAATRLDTPEAAKAANDLRDSLAKPDLELCLHASL